MDITRNGNGVSAIVEYDYEAKARDELNLKKGAIITNIKVQPGGWWEGCLAGGLTGMFPDNFVRVLEPNDKNPVVLRDSSATQNRRCKVIYSYRENKGDELTLAVGDIVEVLEEVEEGWWRGALHGRVGVFPSNFVEAFDFGGSPKSANRKSLTNSFNNGSLNKSRSSLNSSREDLDIGHPDAPSLPPKPVRELCKVLFGYQPHNDDELKLVEGDIITILSKELPDKGWWKGESKGKIGVFPDNFVELLQPEVSSPIKEQQKPERPPPAKILVNKTPNLNNSNSNSNSTSRKDSFGSKDSLNDSGITNTPPVFSNVAAQRRSLQNKNMNIDVNVSPLGGLGSGGGGSAEKPPRKAFDMKTPADIRKSLESLVDDKQKNVTPPPVVGKKPNVPIKKSPSITTVTNSLFSGLKQKVKSVESKLSSGSSHDSMDGIGSSRAMGSQIADNGEKGITGEKLRQGDSELLDQVERTTKLHDMRANRAKAPKRRPPTSNQSNTNSIVIDDDQLEDLNTASPPESPKSEVPGALDDEMAKPKPRGWAKNRAPWMDELKASQMKKTSPNVEPRKINSTNASTNNEHHAERPPFAIASNRKSLESANSMNHSNSTSITSNGSSNFDMRANSIDVVKSSSAHHHETNSVMTKSMSSIGTTKISLIDNNNSNNLNNLNNNNINSNNNNNINTNNNNNLKNDTKTDELIMNNNNNNMNNVNNNNVRPASVNIRNRSISPIARMSSIGGGGGSVVGGNGVGKSVTSNQVNNSTTMSSTTNHVHSESHVGKTTIASTISTSSSSGDDNLNVRVSELETRVLALEKLVTSQKNTIDNLAKKFQDESDKVKTLKTELEKYAQCVTQV